MSVPYWPISLPQSILIPHAKSVSDNRAVFDSDAGPLARPRFTGALASSSFATPPMTRAQFAIFEAWVSDDLANGSRSFCRRDPVARNPRMWKMLGGDSLYEIRLTGDRKVHVSFPVIRMPAVPWFAPYVPEGVSRIPDFVADYENGVYGIEGEKVAASALEDIAGTYVVVTTNATTVETETGTLTAGDITASAPAGVTLILGFAL